MAKTFRGQLSIIQIEDDTGPIEVGVLDDPSVGAPEQEVQELRGAGTTEFVDLQKTETAATTSGTVSEFDIDAWDRLIDYDDTADQLDDNAEVATFTVTTIYESADGSTKEIDLIEGYIDGSIELGGSREEWIGMDLEFRGRTIEITNEDTAEAESATTESEA